MKSLILKIDSLFDYLHQTILPKNENPYSILWALSILSFSYFLIGGVPGIVLGILFSIYTELFNRYPKFDKLQHLWMGTFYALIGICLFYIFNFFGINFKHLIYIPALSLGIAKELKDAFGQKGNYEELDILFTSLTAIQFYFFVL